MPGDRPLGQFADKTFGTCDLYTPEGRHWGQLRLVQLGGSPALQVRVDEDSSNWQDYFAFVVAEGPDGRMTLHHAQYGRRKDKQ